MSGINKIKVANVDYDIVPIKYALEVVESNPFSLALYDCATNQTVSTNEYEINTILNEYVSSYSSKPYPTQIICYFNNDTVGVSDHIILTCNEIRDSAKFFAGESPRLGSYYKVNLNANFDDGSGNIHEITVITYPATSGYFNRFNTIGEVANRTLILYDPTRHVDLGAYDTMSEAILYPGGGFS